MKKTVQLITAILTTVILSLSLEVIGTTVHAAKTFSKAEASRPVGYFSNSKIGVAFHWKSVRTKSGVKSALIFGDFKAPRLTGGYSLGNQLSKNKRTLTVYYKKINTKSQLSKTTYHFTLYKLSSRKYQVKVSNQLPSNHGQKYTFYKTKKSPAKSLANKFSKPVIQKKYKKLLDQQLQKAYQQAKATGQSVQDPATDPQIQQRERATIKVATNSYLKQLVKSFS